MPVCRICGEKKEELEFVKVKHFFKYNDRKVCWCRDCQRMFIEMKRVEEFRKMLSEKITTGLVEFL